MTRHSAIGGYFELDLPLHGDGLYPDAYRFQSARAAFMALLEMLKPSKVWVPRYICDSMLLPLNLSDIQYEFYSIDENFEIADRITLKDSEYLLYVNYFGLGERGQEKTLERFEPGSVIIDNSQALFSPPADCLASIYSPRKFFGVPDGGLLVTRLEIDEVVERDTGSLQRARHLLIRLAEGPEAGYSSYQSDEQQLNDCQPRRMSHLTERMLRSFDCADAKAKRRDNFMFLHASLGEENRLSIQTDAIEAPLCYPFLPESPRQREILTENRLYIARYWSEVLDRTGCNTFEISMARDCLALPCDQRYGLDEMQRILNILQ